MCSMIYNIVFLDIAGTRIVTSCNILQPGFLAENKNEGGNELLLSDRFRCDVRLRPFQLTHTTSLQGEAEHIQESDW